MKTPLGFIVRSFFRICYTFKFSENMCTVSSVEYVGSEESVSNIYITKSSGRSVPLVAPAEGWGALRTLVGTSGPLISSRRCETKHPKSSVRISSYDILG